MFLGDVFQVKSGLVVSRKKANDESLAKFNYKQLNLRAINKNGYLEMSELEVLLTESAVSSEYLTAFGDVVVRLTDPYTAIYITKEYEGLVITSNFAIIRENKNYNSEFLAYYFNGDGVKKQLYSNMQGTVVKSVNIAAIENVVLPEISLRKQKAYSQLMGAVIQKLKNIEKIKILELKLQKNIIEKMSQE